jgi:hypothetical protein
MSLTKQSLAEFIEQITGVTLTPLQRHVVRLYEESPDRRTPIVIRRGRRWRK